MVQLRQSEKVCGVWDRVELPEVLKRRTIFLLLPVERQFCPQVPEGIKHSLDFNDSGNHHYDIYRYNKNASRPFEMH